MALNRPHSTLFYHDTSLIGSRSSLVCFSTSFKTHLLKKRAVKAAKSSRSPSRPVVIHLRRICSRVFCIHYFLKTKPGSRKTITEKCFSCQKKSVCQKLACSCKKWKSTQKVIYAIFVRKHSVIIRFLEKKSYRFQKSCCTALVRACFVTNLEPINDYWKLISNRQKRKFKFTAWLWTLFPHSPSTPRMNEAPWKWTTTTTHPIQSEMLPAWGTGYSLQQSPLHRWYSVTAA